MVFLQAPHIEVPQGIGPIGSIDLPELAFDQTPIYLLDQAVHKAGFVTD
jgi:hypothetical protein